MLEFVAAAAAAVLGLEETTIPVEFNLFEAGMDSLMSLELRRRLERGISAIVALDGRANLFNGW